MQGGIFVLISVAIVGYVFLTNTMAYKFKVPKYQGHHLVYRALTTGLVFFVIAFVILWIFNLIFRDFQVKLLLLATSNGLPSLNLTNIYFLLILTISFVLVLIGIRIYNRASIFEFMKHEFGKRIPINNRLRKKAELYWYLKSTESEFISHFMSTTKIKTLLITLKNNRCYVAVPYEIIGPRGQSDHNELSIIPLVSGYRDPGDMCLELTTDYDEVIDILTSSANQYLQKSMEEKQRMKNTLVSYRVTFSLSELTILSTFDLSKYKYFKESEAARRKEIQNNRVAN
ncbi:hypothetical protein [Saccharospirillum sp.]|uniref:hypothetical protein n=1 Tax=Saccharospirillum sp. TaxID=2033801 RepID=UPI00349FD30A